MNLCFSVCFPGIRAGLSDNRADRSPDNLAKPRSALSGSDNQLEQLVSKQGNDSNHEVESDLLGSPHHHGATPKLFFQSTIKAFRHRPFFVSRLLVRGQWDRLFPAAVSVDDGDVSQGAAWPQIFPGP